MKTLLAGIALAALSATGVVAGTVEQTPGGTTVWQAGVDGVEAEWNADGSIRRISSKYCTPVEFPDRRGLHKAQIIAEEKAKAAIVRYLEQTVSSTRIVAEMQDDLNKATQQRDEKTKSVNKFDKRTMIESLTELTTSFAAGRLKGVIVLEKTYDDKAEEACAVVGVSERSSKGADDIKGMMNGKPGDKSEGGGIRFQPSEARKLKDRDW